MKCFDRKVLLEKSNHLQKIRIILANFRIYLSSFSYRDWIATHKDFLSLSPYKDDARRFTLKVSQVRVERASYQSNHGFRHLSVFHESSGFGRRDKKHKVSSSFLRIFGCFCVNRDLWPSFAHQGLRLCYFTYCNSCMCLSFMCFLSLIGGFYDGSAIEYQCADGVRSIKLHELVSL